MINVNLSVLNPLEQQIHAKLYDYSRQHSNIRISEAAELCDCSVSKISKFVKKLGFENYKQYLDFLYAREISSKEPSDELTRISKFIDEFDEKKVEELITLIEAHDKIILFGYGPSLICAQYFEYRLRTVTNKVIFAVADEISISSISDESTLLILLTVTGKFHTFESIYNAATAKSCQVAMVVEEYNTDLFKQCDHIFWLSKYNQPDDLLPYEKSRTVFFIFLEEVIQNLMRKNKAAIE
jgi:DNA-binding MurR/RpiR family transcriptional regulator